MEYNTWIYPQCWEKLREVNGWFDKNEGALLFEIIKKTPQEITIVEIGTAWGYTAALMAMTGHKVITIDNYKDLNQSPAHPITHIQNTFLRTLPIQFIKGESIEIAPLFINESIDILFIDTNHEYQSVKQDLENWLPKVKSNGIVLFHDYGSWKGVTEAVDENIKEGKLIKQQIVFSLLHTIKT